MLFTLDDEEIAKYLDAIGAHLENIIEDIKAQAHQHNTQVKLTDNPEHNKWKKWYGLVYEEYQNRDLSLKPKNTSSIVEGPGPLKQSLIKCIT